jgi:GAF domain-containing protein
MNDDQITRLVEAVSSATTALEPPGLTALLQAVVDTARELFGAAACSIATVDNDEMYLVYEIASGEGAAAIIGERLPIGRGIAGWVASSGASIAVEDVAADPRFARDIAESTGYVPTSILATPLESRHTVLGVLSVLDRRPPASAADAQRDMTLIGLLAQQVSLSLESAQVFDSAARLLAAALGEAADDADITDVLSAAAATAGNSRRDLVSLARAFARLHQADPALAALAADTVERFAVIAAQRAPW